MDVNLSRCACVCVCSGSSMSLTMYISRYIQYVCLYIYVRVCVIFLPLCIVLVIKATAAGLQSACAIVTIIWIASLHQNKQQVEVGDSRSWQPTLCP